MLKDVARNEGNTNGVEVLLHSNHIPQNIRKIEDWCVNEPLFKEILLKNVYVTIIWRQSYFHQSNKYAMSYNVFCLGDMFSYEGLFYHLVLANL